MTRLQDGVWPSLVIIRSITFSYFTSCYIPIPSEDASLCRMEKSFFIYILASKRNGTLYIGVTSNLIQRVWQHKFKVTDGFTKKYQVTMLVYYEQHSNAENAIAREKELKKWKRLWKIALIQKYNPNWKDLYDGLL